jgi:hypothetical protein
MDEWDDAERKKVKSSGISSHEEVSRTLPVCLAIALALVISSLCKIIRN